MIFLTKFFCRNSAVTPLFFADTGPMYPTDGEKVSQHLGNVSIFLEQLKQSKPR